MDTISNDSIMSKEMMAKLMNSKTSKMMILEDEKITMDNHYRMMKMMKDYPAMVQSMMSVI